MKITLKYACGCEFDFPCSPARLDRESPVENPNGDCPFHRGVVSMEWLKKDIAAKHVRLYVDMKHRELTGKAFNER